MLYLVNEIMGFNLFYNRGDLTVYLNKVVINFFH